MCDTLVSIPGALSSALMLSGNTLLDLSGFPPVLFAKNSDREPDEAQVIVSYPGGPTHGRFVQTSTLELPQVPETQAVILCRPYHLWGAEMGVNFAGVAIGNEALFTKIPFEKQNRGLTGMDLVRLGLERSSTAEEALRVITDLLARYGQDACSGYRNRNTYYHNSFLIADPQGALVLETFGQEWAARRVTGLYAISNGISLGDDYEQTSPGLQELARSNGWTRLGSPSPTGEPRLNLQKTFTAPGFRALSQCDARQAQLMRSKSSSALAAVQTHDRLRGAFGLMRRHPHDEQGSMHPARAHTGYVCMHANRWLAPFQTTGSMVAELRSEGQSRVWLTGTSAPCLSAFKPFYFGGDTLSEASQVIPGERADESLWWQFERLHRQVLQSFRPVAPEVRRVMDRLESAFVTQALALEGLPVGAAHHALSQQALHHFRETVQALQASLLQTPPPRDQRFPVYTYYWERLNEQNGVIVRLF